MFTTNLFIGLICGIGYGFYYNATTGFIIGSLIIAFTSLFKGLLVGLENLKDINKIAKIERPYQRINSGLKLNLIIFGILVVCLLSFDSLISKLEHENLTYSNFYGFELIFNLPEPDETCLNGSPTQTQRFPNRTHFMR